MDGCPQPVPAITFVISAAIGDAWPANDSAGLLATRRNMVYIPEAIKLLLFPTVTRRPDEPVDPHCSRKTFLARLAGLFAVSRIAPRLFARSNLHSAPAQVGPSGAFALRPEPRAVPRRTGRI